MKLFSPVHICYPKYVDYLLWSIRASKFSPHFLRPQSESSFPLLSFLKACLFVSLSDAQHVALLLYSFPLVTHFGPYGYQNETTEQIFMSLVILVCKCIKFYLYPFYVFQFIYLFCVPNQLYKYERIRCYLYQVSACSLLNFKWSAFAGT